LLLYTTFSELSSTFPNLFYLCLFLFIFY